MWDVIVIGAGPAGCAAAVQCRRLGMEVLLLERQAQPGGLVANGRWIENYPGMDPPLTGRQFAAQLRTYLRRFDVSMIRREVQKVIWNGDSAYRVSAVDGVWTAPYVIVAVGTAPRIPEISGLGELRSAQRLFSEVLPLWEIWSCPRTVLIIGAGEAAFDYALSLAQQGTVVELICRAAEPRAIGGLREQVLRTPHIRLHAETRVIRAELNAAGVMVCVTRRDDASEAFELIGDAILVATGRTSAAPPLLDREILKSGFQSLTPAPGLYICGDARHGSLGQVAMAIGDGMAAALHIATQRRHVT